MFARKLLAASLAVLALATARPAQAAPPPRELFEGAASGVIERLLVAEFKDLEVEHKDNWDNTISVITGYKPVWQGIKTRMEPIRKEVPHGLWTKSRVALDNAADNLDVKIRNVRRTDKLEVAFQVYVSGRLRGEMQARAYNHGAQLARSTFKGRARVQLTVDCQAGLYRDGDKVVLRTKVLSADLKYSDVVLDRAGHFGGYSARVLGDSFTGAVDKWAAGKKRDTLNKARDAVKKALGYERRIEEPMRSHLIALIKAMG